MFPNSEVGLSLQNGEVPVQGWGGGPCRSLGSRMLNGLAPRLFFSAQQAVPLGCWDTGPWLQGPGASLGDRLAFLRARIKLPQGEPGNCFWPKSKVRELRTKWPLALTVSSLLGGDRWERRHVEVKGKKVKLNPWSHSWLARGWKFLFACVVGLPLTCILLKGDIFF